MKIQSILELIRYLGSDNIDEGLCEMPCEGSRAATQVNEHGTYLIWTVFRHLVEVNLRFDWGELLCIRARHSVFESPYLLFGQQLKLDS